MDDALVQKRSLEDKAKKASLDASRLADELRAEQEHAHTQEKMRKGLEVTVKELQVSQWGHVFNVILDRIITSYNYGAFYYY